MASNDMVRTGIEGLDGILLGGIPRDNTILVQGPAGSGKTLLGIEFVYRGATQFNEPGIIVVFETSPDKLIRDAATFGWDLEELQRQNKLQIVFTTPQVLNQELRSPDSLLMERAMEMGARRLFVDGVGLLSPAHGSDPTSGVNSEREGLQQLVQELHRHKVTGLFSHELSTAAFPSAASEMAGFLMDTVIQVNRYSRNRQSLRSIEIVKSRGQRYDTGEHTLNITDNKGLQVFRRVQAPREVNLNQPSSETRSAIGVDVLDTLIGGGIFDGSTTMVIGVSGVGKTVLGNQLLAEGAAKQSKRGLMISLDEHPAQIVRNAETISLGLKAHIDSGMIHILFESPQELDVDKHYADIVRLIEEHNIQRMVVDGMTSYSTALEDPRVYRDFFHALVAYTKKRLMTTFFNYENPEFLGVSSYMPDFPVSSIVDNIILLSIAELNNSLHRCLTVVKARGSKHEFETREYVIGQGGMKLLPKNENAPPALAFQNYTSMLSRAPTRFVALQSATSSATASGKS